MVALILLLVLGPASCVLGPAFLGPGSQTKTLWPTTGWTRATPASHGLAAERFEALEKDMRAGAFGYTDRVLVVRNGRLVVDIKVDQDYRAISRGRKSPIGCGFGCDDPAWMHEFNYLHPDFHPFFKGREVHSLQSVTKSIAATAIGVALGQGRLGALDRPFLEFFKDKDLSRVDPRLRRSTLRDLLTMRSGIEWHEQDRPLDDSNTTIQLERSRDWIQFTLDQPMDSDPGTKWAYNSGGSHLQAGIIRTATGRHIDDYAREFLFEPLGITDWYWKKSPTGFPDSEGGLYLRAEDLAKIGYLYLNDGVWNGRRMLPDGWVRDATTPHARVNTTWNYGFQWWITTRNGVDVWAGRGFGGQLLFVIPARQAVAVANAWNVFGAKARDLSGALLDAVTAPLGDSSPVDAGQTQDLRALQLRMTVDGGDDFVIVESVGADVRVRAVRVASANEYCAVPVVQAVERMLPRTTVAAVAGVPVCAMSAERVQAALAAAPDARTYVDFVGSLDAVVAGCRGGDKEFVFIMPPLVNRDVLAGRSPDVHALWDLGRRMRAVAFERDSRDPFAGAVPAVQSAREALGTSMVPVLLGGTYSGYLKPTLSTYTGPPAQREPSWVEIENRASLKLADYVEPVMPPIARSARVFGDVRLRLRVDATTGAVTDVELLPSPPLLSQAAVDAVRRWRFAAGAVPSGPLDVTVRFRLKCPPLRGT